MNALRIIIHLSIALIAIALGQPLAFAEQDNSKVIKLGMSTALSGPAQNIGLQLYKGSSIYFNKVNNAGGINGAEVQLLVANDNYEPKQTVNNTRTFIYSDKVDALFGAMGTPTSHAIIPLLEQSKIPFLMPFSGASFLHDKSRANIFNLRASYNDEAAEQIKYLVEERKHTKIGLFIQADEFGLYVESGLRKELTKYDLSPIKVARYQRNSHDVASALNALQASGVTAICLVGTYAPLGEFINSAHAKNFTPDYTSVSFVPSFDLFDEVTTPSHIMVTEIVPNPLTCNDDFCNEFLADMQANKITKPNRLHFEGYINAMAFSRAAANCKLPLKHSCLMKELNSLLINDKIIKKFFIDTKNKNKRNVYRSYYVNK
jgi:ABC-type branched-subunit amino acid transport system substrate-binding protein